MNQQTLQFMKQTQIAETCKKNAEAYFNTKDKPDNPTARPPECQQINYSFHNPLLTSTGIVSRINNLSNYNYSIKKEGNNQIVDDLKCLAKSTHNPTKLNQLTREFYKHHPDCVYPLVASLCTKEDTEIASTLASTPIDIKEIGPYFALSDEINHADDNNFNSPLMAMISKEANNSYIQLPSFISTLKRSPPEQFTEEAAQRFNYYIRFQYQMKEQIPQLNQAFNFDEYNYNNTNDDDNNNDKKKIDQPKSNKAAQKNDRSKNYPKKK